MRPFRPPAKPRPRSASLPRGGAAMSEPTVPLRPEAAAIQRLVASVFERYGYDFRDYAYASLRRRLLALALAEQVDDLAALEARLLGDPASMERLLRAITVNVTSMFRDPGFFLTFRNLVVPYLRTYPFLRIWHAGCSTGEEVYSLAILLQEEGLYDRCRIYATDLSEPVLKSAKAGVFPLSQMREYTSNYIKAGGTRDFSAYYTAKGEGAIFRNCLGDKVLFAQHNLVTDGSINEFNVILCRNVMIYFNEALQAHVHRLILSSLAPFGLLAIGRRESLRFTPFEDEYVPVDEREKVYRRIQ